VTQVKGTTNITRIICQGRQSCEHRNCALVKCTVISVFGKYTNRENAA